MDVFNRAKAIPIVRYIDMQMSANKELTTDPLLMEVLECWAYEFPKIAETPSGSEMKKLLERGPEGNPEFKDSVFALLFALFENKLPKDMVEDGRKYEWWRMEYYIWFAHWSREAFVEVGEFRYPWTKSELPARWDMRKLISDFGTDCFRKDAGGNGRTFVPGLFCLALYAQTLDKEGFSDLKQQFEAETLMSFDLYRASLYETNGEWQTEYEKNTSPHSTPALQHLEPY